MFKQKRKGEKKNKCLEERASKYSLMAGPEIYFNDRCYKTKNINIEQSLTIKRLSQLKSRRRLNIPVAKFSGVWGEISTTEAIDGRESKQFAFAEELSKHDMFSEHLNNILSDCHVFTTWASLSNFSCICPLTSSQQPPDIKLIILNLLSTLLINKE